MDGQVYIVHGDITRLRADAIALTRGISFSTKSSTFVLLKARSETDFEDEYQSARAVCRDTDRAFWVPMSTSSATGSLRGVVFVSPHGRTSQGDHPAEAVVTHAVDTAVRHLREQTQLPVLVALVAFRMKMGADRQDRLRSAIAQVRAAYRAVASHTDVDVAFVIEDLTKYEIFLDARRKVVAEMKVSRPRLDEVELAPLVEALKNEECVLFIGAGLSQNAGITSYSDLIGEMAHRIDLADDLPNDMDTALDVAQCFRDQDQGEKQVAALVGKHFGRGATKASPSLAHYLAMSLPVRFIVTTNYDRLLETTLENLRRFPLRVVGADQVARTGYRDGTYVVKFHGDADDGPVVLSRNDYDAFFRDHPEMASLLEGLLLNQTFFFLGYSLRDPNFRQIYSKIDFMLRTAKRPAFLTTFEATNAATSQQYRNKQLNLIELGTPKGEGAPPDKGAPKAMQEAKDRDRLNAARRLFAFLDRLAEEVLGHRHLFLVPDAQPSISGPLRDVYKTLRTAGWQLADSIQKPLTTEQTLTAARLLSALADQGWVPKDQGVTLTGLWDRLACNLDGVEGARREQRQFLISALRYADTSSAAKRLRARLAEIGE